MRSSFDIPKLFEGAIDYQHDLDALELAQSTFNEEALYVGIEELSLDWWQRTKRKPRILDLCCATGLCSYRVCRKLPAECVALVDTDAEALRRASLRFGRLAPKAMIHCEDAVAFSGAGPFDLILLNSAYHHIDDLRKWNLLERARLKLAPGGRIILGEHFLPEYNDEISFRQSVLSFYGALIEALNARGESERAVNTIRCAGLLSFRRMYEYKVSWSQFTTDAARAGLMIEDRVPVWQPTSLDGPFVGTLAIQLGSRGWA